jgi:hypothetical protein
VLLALYLQVFTLLGPVVFVTRKQVKRTRKHFVATNVLVFELQKLEIIHVLYNNYTMSIASVTFQGGERTILPNTTEDQ